MSRSDYHTLINRGRKAGLKTSELYRALSARPPEATDAGGQSDENGFVVGYTASGQRVYRPANDSAAP
jgi:hypothetical protein